MSVGAASPDPTAFVAASSLAVSDSLAPAVLRLWLNRCPTASDAARLAAASAACTVLPRGGATRADFYAATSALPPAATALADSFSGVAALAAVAAPCDPTSSLPALLSPAVAVGVPFGTAAAAATLACRITAANSGVSLAYAAVAVAATPTLWPVWDDAILVIGSGFMRSARLGVVVNATAALLSAYGTASEAQSAALGSLVAAAASTPAAALQAAQVVWAAVPLPNSSSPSAAAFTLTLSGSSTVVLRSAGSTRAFAPGGVTNASVGSAPCNVSAVSADGRWALLQTPTAVQLCGTEATDCGYATLSLSNAPTSAGQQLRGATLPCPPFCAGAVGGGVIPVATGDGGFALGTAPAAGAPGALPVMLPAVPAASTSQGVYYTVACSQVWVEHEGGGGVTLLPRLQRAAHCRLPQQSCLRTPPLSPPPSSDGPLH